MVLVVAEDDDGVRVLTLQRPDARNAMSTALLGELLDAVADAVADGEVRVLVVTGSGGSFSAGADLREELDHAGQVRRMDLFCQVYEAVATCPKPTMAAVEGHCVGGGVEVAAACDLRVAGATASFRFPGAALGIPVGAAKLVGLVGLGAAKDLVLTSRTFDVDEALRIGFVQRLTPEGGALDVAQQAAAQIAGNHPDAVAQLKRHFDRFSGLRDRVAVENDALHGLAEAGGDYTLLTMPDPKRSWSWPSSPGSGR
ncbi:MAG TPA: enoyl-CoA hydratase/isomerase family protein [Egibacteraceae bacterium]|nr:enoyl-CoA hydratase/isomerase family protein [Egibacteraceae bacterium]